MPDAEWLPDPTGRFQYRYWDGSQWSSAVSRQGSQETDVLSVQPAPPAPPPTATPPPTAAAPPPVAAAPPSTDPAATNVGGPLSEPPPVQWRPSGAVATASPASRTVGPGEALVAVGVIAIVVSIFLQWFDFSKNINGTQITRRITASGVPIQVLVNYTTGRHDPTLLVLLIPIAVLCLLGLLLVQVRWLALLGGVLAVLIAAMYSYQLRSAVHGTPSLHGFGLFDFLGVGAIVCFVGGLLATVGGAILVGRGSPR